LPLCLLLVFSGFQEAFILNPSSKAILVFAQSASRDAADKRLPGSERIFEHLTRLAIEKAKRTGFPVFHFNEEMQEGTSFEERLTNAMQTLFDRGFEHLVVIGNDSPDLTTATLRDAVASLDHKKAVFGPSDDGGVYLIGLHRDHFEYNEFRDLPWRREHLFQRMIFWIHSRGIENILVLNCKMDLDTKIDFRNWSAGSKSTSGKLIRLIAALLQASPNDYFYKSLNFSQARYPFIRFNKGSPALCL